MISHAAADDGSTNLQGINARDINVVKINLTSRIEPHERFLIEQPVDWEQLCEDEVPVSILKKALVRSGGINKPIYMKRGVTGTFFPSALLSAGWWENFAKVRRREPRWRSDIQKWLHHGFQEWAPSWDFTWQFDEEGDADTRWYIAQLADGDEANSIPVMLPYHKARSIYEYCSENWGGFEACVTGVLCHRTHFPGGISDPLFGESLDFCLRVDLGDDKHKITPLIDESLMYSGYLWKCLAPKAWIKPGLPVCLDQVFFVWEHTDFTKSDALKYNLDSLARKEEYLCELFGDLVLLQKSSSIFVPGVTEWTGLEFYECLMGRKRCSF